ncbi:MAG: DUF2726 domain-containing protein [Pseudorhodobacter sp.]|nr:DUF2726 domain-containing protein [Pseudorhodobacter sp.]
MIQQNPFFTSLSGANPQLLGPLIAFGAVVLVVLGSRLLKPGRPSRYQFFRPRFVPVAAPSLHPHNMANPHDQMDAIAAVEFEVSPLLNHEEARLLPVLEAVVRDVGNGHRVMAQTSLGEIIRPKNASASPTLRNAAYASINSKRLDFAVFDRFGKLVAAVEYQGSGHYQKNAFLRDAVKREALRKAGVPYVEVQGSFAPDEVRARLRAILQPAP